jgi:hypothetical protein
LREKTHFEGKEISIHERIELGVEPIEEEWGI